MKRMNKRVGVALASTAVAASLALGGAQPASASSTVHTGGHVGCKWLGKYYGAKSITIRIDSGESHTVSTGLWNDVYRIDFSYMPSGGIGATVTVNCVAGASDSPGNHSTRAFFKPDWRNTTGDHNFYVNSNGAVHTYQA